MINVNVGIVSHDVEMKMMIPHTKTPTTMMLT
jgi:hypothetical protein